LGGCVMRYNVLGFVMTVILQFFMWQENADLQKAVDHSKFLFDKWGLDRYIY
jgi:hypothetical protein